MTGSTITLCDYPVEQAIEIFRNAGFTRLEMWLHHLERCKTPALCRTFAPNARIQMGGLNVVGEDYFLPFGTGAEREETMRMMKRDIDLARDLGARDVLVWEGRAPAGTTESEWINGLLPGLIEFFRTAIEYAKPRGIRVLTEPHPFTVGMSDRFLIALCDALDPEYFGITYDFCHYGVGRPRDYVQAIRTLGSRIRHLHFSDTDMKTSELHFPAGRGCLDVQGILKALREIRFNGTMALDLYGYPTPVEALMATTARYREAADYLGLPNSSV